MRVVALGGCGGMGRYAVETALGFPEIDHVIVGDLDGAKATAFALACGDKASAVEVDVTNSERLVALLSSADVVLNTVGPFYRFGVPILSAAIEAGCHYLDINDDWEPTLEMLSLHEDAKAARISAVIGMGASPGISNLLAVKAMAELDKVDTLITGWGGKEDANGPPAGAALDHWLHQCSGTIRRRRDGQFVDVAPLEDVFIDYPGLGTVKTYTVGHPEPVTLPLMHPEMRNCVNVMDLPPAVIEVVRGLARDIDRGRITVEQGADRLRKLETSASALFSKMGLAIAKGSLQELLMRKTYLPSIFAWAIGDKGGTSRTVGVALKSVPPFGMGGITGIPLAVALKMFVAGHVKRRGVFAPEGAIDPDPFFDALAPYCNPPCDSGEALLAIDVA